ncbi:hypothetical protein BGW41_007629 [Actinomortierella wolfii]|nr:hypothetical protein BGW41_007629 [Actinomortierella wolfii]
MALIHPRHDTTLFHAPSTPSPLTPSTAIPEPVSTVHNNNNSNNSNLGRNDDADSESWDDLDLRPLEHIFNRSPLSLSDSSSASDPGDYFQLPIDRHASHRQQQQQQLQQQRQQEHQIQQKHQQGYNGDSKEASPVAVPRSRAWPPRPMMNNRAVSPPSAVATTFLPTPVTPTPPSRLRPRPTSCASSSSATSSSSSSSSSATASIEVSTASVALLQDGSEAVQGQSQEQDPPVSVGSEPAPAAASTSAPAAPGRMPPPLHRQNSFQLPAYSGTITHIYAEHSTKEVVNDWADDMEMPTEGFDFSQVRAVLAARSSKAPQNEDEVVLALMDEAMGSPPPPPPPPASSSLSTSASTSAVRHTAKNQTTCSVDTKDIDPGRPTLSSHTSSSSASSASFPSSPTFPSSLTSHPSSPLRPRSQLTALTLAKNDQLAIPTPLKSPTSLLARYPLSSPPLSPSAPPTVSTCPALTTTPVHANATLVGAANNAAQALKKSVSSPVMETIETLDDDFDLPDHLDTVEFVLKWRRGLEPNAPAAEGLSSTRWRGSPDSEVEELDFGTPLETNSLASSASLSRDATATTTTSTGMTSASVAGEDLMEGIEFPESLEGLQLVTERARQTSQEPHELKKKKSDEEFWDGIELGEDASLPLNRRNKYVVVRQGSSKTERRQSRVCREEVPLKDFIAAPSKIPRLSRPPGDYSRPVSPAPTLSRSHSTHLDLPHVQYAARSSLPRSTRGSVRSRVDSKGALALSMSDSTISSSVQSTPFVSRAPTPTLARLSFNLQGSATPRDETAVDDGQDDDKGQVFSSHGSTNYSKRMLRPPSHTGRRALEGLRSLARRLEPKIAKRREIPSFDKAALPPLPTTPSTSSVGLTASKHSAIDLKRPSFSRSSSYTDWETELDLDDLPIGRMASGSGRSSQENNDGRLSCVSTMSEAKSVASSTMGLFPKRVFLKRGAKYDTFGDGSELERFDILPTFDLTTPAAKPEVSRIPKSKSFRRSLFEIFGPSAEPAAKEAKKKKTKPGKGPTLIRNLSQSDKPKDIDGMVYNPEHKMWDGNNDILDDFEDNEPFVFPPPPPVPAQPPVAQQVQHPGICNSPSIWSASTVTRPALISNMNHYSSGGQRPQVSGKMVFDPVSMSWRFNPAYLALRRAKRKLKNPQDDLSDLDDAWGDEPNVFAGLSDDSDKSDDDDNDDDDGSNPGSHNDQSPKRVIVVNGEDEGTNKMDDADDGMLSEVDEEKDHKPASKNGGSGRKSRFGSIRLQIPPRFSSEDLSSIDKDDAIANSLAMWSEQPPEPSSATTGFGSMRGFPQLRTVGSKSSRKSLRACLAANGVFGGGVPGLSGGGFSSRDEFEVGLEFDITEKFLEECLAAEAQHRRDAGRFFALPCTPASSSAAAATPAATTVTTIKSRLASSIRSTSNQDKKKSTLPRKIKQATLKGLFGDKSAKKDQVEEHKEQEQPQQPQKPLKQSTKKKSLMSLRAMIKGNKSPGATLALDNTVVTNKPLHRRLPLPEAFRKHKASPAPATENNEEAMANNELPSHEEQQSLPSEPSKAESSQGKGIRVDGTALNMGTSKQSFSLKKKRVVKAKTLGHAAASSMQQHVQQPHDSQGGKSLMSLFSNTPSATAGTSSNNGDERSHKSGSKGHYSSFRNNSTKDGHYRTSVCNKVKTFDAKTMGAPQRLSYAATLAIVRRGGPSRGVQAVVKGSQDTTASSPVHPKDESEQEPATVLPDSSTGSGSMTGSSSVALVDLKQLAMNCNGINGSGAGDSYQSNGENGHTGSSSSKTDGHVVMVDDEDDDEAYESDEMERGYRIPSDTRGRPPPHRLADILREFELATIAKEQQLVKKKLEQQQQTLVVATKQLS